jgi:pyruvate formate lyase activating enzyme
MTGNDSQASFITAIGCGPDFGPAEIAPTDRLGTEEDATRAPLILEIKGNSLDDGPGIRSVVFFKGCPLSCVWCHNPEGKITSQEISFDTEECVGCDTCLKTCPDGALSRNNFFFIDRARCSLCFACVETCPSGALGRVGKQMSIDDILSCIRKDKPFFDTSGGGVTLSGGEPTLHMTFLSDLLRSLRSEGIHTLLETCGHFKFDKFRELALPHLDTIYFDVKLIDSKEHRRFCGADNGVILANLARLVYLSDNCDLEILPRVPLVPGITDGDSNLAAIAAVLQELGLKRVQLMAYNPLWHEKAAKIGVPNSFSDDPVMHRWMLRDHLRACGEIFERSGVQTIF